MNNGLIFIPKYVRQESDLNFGEVVTHENYNEKLNLNTTQGDYNTEVLFKLFNTLDSTNTYHIPYLDKEIENCNTAITTVDNRVTTTNTRIDNLDTRVTGDINTLNTNLNNLSGSVDTRFLETNTRVSNLEDGTTPIAHTQYADAITGASTVGPNYYYGTDFEGTLGMNPLPPFISAYEVGPAADINGVYYIPLANSVAESMLTPELRTKVNTEAISDYTLLSNLPQINSITLTGNKSLSDLGIQAVGNYVTSTTLNTTLASYYRITDAQSWVNTQLNSYATISSLNTTNGNVTTAQNRADAAYSLANTANTTAGQRARISVNTPVSNPQNGDVYFTV